MTRSQNWIEEELRKELLKNFLPEQVEKLISMIKNYSPSQITHMVAVGPPCAGKGTGLDAANVLPVKTTSALLKEARKADNEQGRQIAKIMSEGGLVTDDIIIPLILRALAKAEDKHIFDGAIRNRVQALAWMLAGVKFKMIWFDADIDTLINRAENRLVCPKCGTSYSKSDCKSPVCTKQGCGATLTTRPDDKEIVKRIRIFKEESAPALELLIECGIECLYIDTVAHTTSETANMIIDFVRD